MLTGSFDQSSLEIGLNQTMTLNLSLMSEGGFSGEVGLTGSVVDSNGSAILGVTVALGSADVTLSDGQTQTVPVMVSVESDTTGTVITGANLVVTATSSLSPVMIGDPTTIDNTFTVTTLAGTGSTIANHPINGGSFNVQSGAKIVFINNDTVNHEVHATAGGGTSGMYFVHEENGGPPGDVYTIDLTGAATGVSGQLGCHDHESGAQYATFTVL